MTPLLTVAEVADRLRVDESTVRRHINTGSIPASKPCGVLRIDSADLDAYLEATRVQAQRPIERHTPAPSRRASPRRVSGGSVRDRLRADRKKAAA